MIFILNSGIFDSMKILSQSPHRYLLSSQINRINFLKSFVEDGKKILKVYKVKWEDNRVTFKVMNKIDLSNNIDLQIEAVDRAHKLRNKRFQKINHLINKEYSYSPCDPIQELYLALVKKAEKIDQDIFKISKTLLLISLKKLKQRKKSLLRSINRRLLLRLARSFVPGIKSKVSTDKITEYRDLKTTLKELTLLSNLLYHFYLNKRQCFIKSFKYEYFLFSPPPKT